MKNISFNLIILAALFVSILLATNANFVERHELGHYAINRHFQMNSTIIYYPLMLGGITIPDTNLSLEEDLIKFEKAGPYHILNEIIGYNVLALAFAVLGGCLMVAAAIILRGGES